ncbi:MAG: transporter substrate-binding domain-containing protein [Alphaproteobacteria bacterium]|jgi:ABC-type amino acid transport substrate-binding protein|nr:transporter substrate-binding domain-containing protein [Alphaproteobacteria bacterium]
MKKLFLCLIILMYSGISFAEEGKESAFDRILRTQTIRCGYVVYPPSIIKDPNTGRLSGIFYDITEKMGERLNLKIEWTEEVVFPTMLEGLKTKRYDVLCLNGWGSAHLAPHVSMTIPLYYSVINAFVRKDDLRFDRDRNSINNPSVKISTIDGTGTAVFANQTFPRAQQVGLPQGSDYSLTILNVINNKADVVLIENSLANEFLKKNPNSIRQVNLSKPLRYYANSFYVDIHEQELQSMLSMTLGEMLGAGEVDGIISKYDTGNPASYLPTALPYGGNP